MISLGYFLSLDESVAYLMSVYLCLRCSFRLKELDLSGTSIDAKGLKDILTALQNKGLEKLDLSRNK